MFISALACPFDYPVTPFTVRWQQWIVTSSLVLPSSTSHPLSAQTMSITENRSNCQRRHLIVGTLLLSSNWNLTGNTGNCAFLLDLEWKRCIMKYGLFILKKWAAAVRCNGIDPKWTVLLHGASVSPDLWELRKWDVME